MDDLQKYMYRQKFENSFLKSKGSDFQNWFVSIANAFYGANFERVRPMGAIGDFKCDGYVTNEEIVFQCYAPDENTEQKVNKKIEEDFNGAKTHWSGQIKKWIFVHNDARGLGPNTVQLLNKIRKENVDIEIESWGETEIRSLASKLNLSQLESIFGSVPSRTVLDKINFEDLAEVILKIETLEPNTIEIEIKPVSSQKLEKNSLGLEASELLRIGRRKESLVQQYFESHPQPDFGEKIAESFRAKYQALVSIEMDSEKIFNELQNFAGGLNGTAKSQGAVLAVLSYFFERCDIFEDPDDVGI